MSLLIVTTPRTVTYSRLSPVDIATKVRASVKRVSAHIEAMRARINWIADDIKADEEAAKAAARQHRFSVGLETLKARVAAHKALPMPPAPCGVEGVPSAPCEVVTLDREQYRNALAALGRLFGGPGLEPPAPVTLECTPESYIGRLEILALRWSC